MTISAAVATGPKLIVASVSPEGEDQLVTKARRGSRRSRIGGGGIQPKPAEV